MSISHRTNRLKLVGQPSVEQLQNGRYRLTVTCSTINSREDWYSANKDRIFPDFGSLQSAEMSIDGLAPREGEAYADMRLTKVESGNRSGMGAVGDYNVELTYETLGSAFVQVKDDTTDYELNGLRRVTRTSIAEAGIDYTKTVGTSFIDHQINSETAVRCYLASYSVDDTDSFRQVQEVYVEAGTLSETLDNVGSQKAKVIETIGIDPVTPDGYSLASKQESDFEGFQTNRFTFLKKDVELSRSEDKVGSQLAITTEVFEPVADPQEEGYSLARTEVSDVEGIPTKRFTFLKDNVILSVTQDKVGSQESIINEVFNPATYDFDGVDEDNVTLTGYVEASRQASEFEGIKTVRYTFLKKDVKLSASEDKVGSQKAIVEEWFKPEEGRETKLDYSLARKEESDVEGIPTERYTFLKDNVELSRSEDKVGSQLAITTQVFKPTSDPTESGYSLARKEVSDVDGIPTEEYTFLKNNSVLSVSQDRVGSQLAVTNEIFNPTVDTVVGVGVDDIALVDYSEANRQKSDFEGIPTIKYSFLKNDVQLSKSEDNVGSQLAEIEEWFNPDPSEDRNIKTGYSLAKEEASDVEGIPTERYTFLKNDVLLSESEDKVGSQKAIIEEWFNPDPASTRNVKTDYSLAREEISDISGIPTVKYTFLKPSVLSRDLQISKGGTIQTETVETFEIIPLTSLVAGVDESIITISRDESNYEGIKTLRYVFVLADGQTRIRTRSGPPELAGSTIKTIVSVGTEAVESATGELIESIDELADGFSIFTREYLMPFDNQTPLTGLKRTYSDSIKVRVPGAIQLQVVNVSIETVTGQEATVLDTPPSTQNISVDVEVSIETTDPARTVPPFDMGKIRCSLSMERMTHSYRGFQSYTSSIPPVIDQATGEVITQGETITNYYPKQSVSSSASVRVYPERYLIGSDSLTAELKYQSQLNRAQQVGGGVPLSNTPLYDTKQVNMRVTGSTAPKGYSTSGTIKTDSRPIITTADGVTYYEVVRWKTNGTSSVEFPIAQAGSSGSTSSLGVPQLPDNPTVYGAEDAPLYTEGGMSLSPSLYGSFLG